MQHFVCCEGHLPRASLRVRFTSSTCHEPRDAGRDVSKFVCLRRPWNGLESGSCVTHILLPYNELRRVMYFSICFPTRPLHAAWRGGIHRSRFGCGSSRSMAMVIPPTNPKGSYRARRRDGGEQTGAWETRGARQRGRWPLPNMPSDEFGGCPPPRTARHKGGRREGGPAALTRAVPSEDLDSRQRSREVRRTQCEVTGRLLQVKRPERLARLGPFRFPPTRSRTSPGTRPEPPPSVVLASVGQASGGRSSRNSR
jgi:hypothetical protein